MWLLPWPLPAPQRVRLPSGRHRIPWYLDAQETARLSDLLTGLIEGVDRQLVLPWSAVQALATRRADVELTFGAPGRAPRGAPSARAPL
ncbi:MAG: hypothetical protein IT372_35830 [Polyangiaceae bacterium]|nr:hypothetical protein [Polyangiaceae bacterium]